MPIGSIKQARALKGKRLLVRVDYNVPLVRGHVADDVRLLASIPTIRYACAKGARVILISHLGRPDGKRVASLSLAPIAKRLGELLKKKVHFVSDTVGPAAKRAVMSMKDGDIVMLENIRFSPGEQGNSGELAKRLANLGNLFVLDGFAVAHRADASVACIPAYLPSCAGLGLMEEISGLTKVMKHPKSPFVLVMGGIKMETKIPVLRALMTKTDTILLGGGIVNTMLKARGYDVGNSLVDAAYMKEALFYWKKKNVVVPLDVIVGKKFSTISRRVEIQKKPHMICKRGEEILDIGPATIRLYASFLKKAKTIIWNGAMGYFEEKSFATGTLSIARLVASTSKGKAFGVIGGGETVQAMELTGMSEHVDLVSTGGGAMLEFLAGGKLPGIEALKKRK